MKIVNAFLLEVLKDNRDICHIPDNEHNAKICKFIINVRQRDGSEYESNTDKGIVASIDRHIRSNNYGNSIKKGHAFDQARRVLTAKTMDLKEMGKRNKPNKAQPLTDDEVDKLYTTGRWGCIIQMHY